MHCDPWVYKLNRQNYTPRPSNTERTYRAPKPKPGKPMLMDRWPTAKEKPGERQALQLAVMRAHKLASGNAAEDKMAPRAGSING